MAQSEVGIRLSVSGDAQVRGALDGVQRSMGQVSSAAAVAQAAAGPLMATISGTATIAKLVAVQREFDVLDSSLKTVTGSSAAAAREMEWIKQFAKETPFGLTQATQAFVKMKALGLDPTRASLVSFGNTASAMGKDLNQMIEAVADASTGEFERLKEFGIQSAKEGDKVKFTFQGITTSVGSSAKEITAYLEGLGNNQFAGAMATRAATLDGAIASLSDSWDELFRTVSQQNAGSLINDSVRMAEGAVTDLTNIIIALNGTTAENARQAGAMATVQEGLATAFEAVAVLGVNVKYTLVQIGNELGGLAAQAAAVATGQFAEAAEIGRLMRSDAVAARAEVDATSARILNARKMARLSAPNNYDEPAFLRAKAAAIGQVPAATTAGANASKKKKEADDPLLTTAKAYAKVLEQINSATIDSEATTQGYTKTQKTLLDLFASDEFRTMPDAWKQTIAEQAEAVIATEQLAEAEKTLATARAGSLKLSEAAEEAQAASADQLAERLASMRDEIALIGLTAQQVAELTAAKAEQVIADKEIELIMLRNADASASQISALEREINLRRQLVGAMRDKTVKEAAAESADLAQKEWKKASEQIEQSLTDALMRGFESGKGFAETLRDTVANMFKTLVLRPIVSAVVSPVAGAITAGLGLPGAASAATTGANAMSGMGVLSGSLGALGTGLGAGAGMIAGGGVGGWLTASTSLIGTGTAAGAMAGIGALAGPIGAALAVASLLKGLDDSGTMHTGGIGGYSAAGGTATGAAAGLRFGVDAKDYSAATATASAQIAQSIVGMLDSTAATFGQQAGYYAATAFADDSSRDGAWSALMIKLGDKLVLDWASNPDRDANVPREFSDGEAGAKEYAAAVAKDVRDYLITQTPAWADTMLTALGDAPSLEQLAATVGQINATATALEGMGQASAAFAGMTEAATSTLITAMGGAEAAVASLSGYYTNFYTESERTALATATLTGQLGELGQAMPDSRAAFRGLVDAAVAAGDTKLAAGLINLQDEFAALVPAANDAATAVSKSIDTLRGKTQSLQVRGLEALGDKTGAAALQRSIDTSGMTAAEVALYDYNRALETHVDELTRAAQSIKTLGAETSTLRVQLLQAQGDTAGAKALQRATDTQGFTAAEVAAYDYNQSLRDQIAAAQAASESAQNLAGALDSVSTAANESRRAANQAIAQAMRSSAEYTFSRSQRDIDAAMRGSQAMYQARIKSVESQIDSISGIASAIAAAKDRLNPLASQPLTQTTYKQALYEVDRAATEGGIRQPGLDAALTAVSGDTTSLFGRREDWSMQQARALGSVTTLNTRAQTELAALQSMVALLEQEAQREQERMEALKQVEADRFESQMAKLENQLANDTLQLAATYDSASIISGAVDASAGTIAGALGSAFGGISSVIGGMSSAIASIGTASWAGPSYAVGTPFVPQDGLAMLHKGEMVVPAAYNPNATGYRQADSNAAVVAELRTLNERMARVEAATTATAGFTAGTDRQLRRVIKSDAISTEAIA